MASGLKISSSTKEKIEIDDEYDLKSYKHIDVITNFDNRNNEYKIFDDVEKFNRSKERTEEDEKKIFEESTYDLYRDVKIMRQSNQSFLNKNNEKKVQVSEKIKRDQAKETLWLGLQMSADVDVIEILKEMNKLDLFLKIEREDIDMNSERQNEINHRTCHLYYPKAILNLKTKDKKKFGYFGYTVPDFKFEKPGDEGKSLIEDNESDTMNNKIKFLLWTPIRLTKNFSIPNNLGSLIINQRMDKHLENEIDVLSEAQVLIYIYQIAAALEWLHSKKMIHRDIRCRNIVCQKRKDNKQWNAMLCMAGAGSLIKYTKDMVGYGNRQTPEITRKSTKLIKTHTASSMASSSIAPVKSIQLADYEDDIDVSNNNFQNTDKFGRLKTVPSLYRRHKYNHLAGHGNYEIDESKLTQETELKNERTLSTNSSYVRIGFKNEQSVYHQPPEIHEILKANSSNKEKLDGKRLCKSSFTKKTDIYQFGCTMFEMISYGRKPFTHNNTESAKYASEIYDIKELESVKIINSNLFYYKKYSVETPTYHQPLLTNTIRLCTSYEPLQRPTITALQRFHLQNVLAANGIQAKECLCDCGKKTYTNEGKGYQMHKRFYL